MIVRVGSWTMMWAVLSVAWMSCNPAPPLSTGSVGAATTTAALESRICLPGRLVGTLPTAGDACPQAGAGWRVYKHRSAVASMEMIDPDSKDPAPTKLVAATCSYVWLAAGPPDKSTLPPAPDGWLQPLCVDEPPLPPTMRQAACPAGLQLGLRPRDVLSCPTADGWEVAALFPEKNGELGRYCQYTAHARQTADDPDHLTVPIASQADLSRLPPWVHGDCAVIGGLATAAQRTAIEDAFLDAAESLPTLPLVGGAQPAHVRVAVVDSALDQTDNGLPGVGRASHGRTMGVIAARLGCPMRDGTSACTADVQNQPVLWLERTPGGFRRDPRGGFFGTQADLAVGIVAAVDAAPPGEPLVVNISLGWSPDFGGGEPAVADFPPPVRAVYTAIEYARCRGALVVAAAGNASGKPATPVGPLLPGGWETRPAPTLPRCHELGITAATPPAAGRPLVHAAGGVDRLDRPLYNTPLAGRSRLAAVAANAAIDDPAPARLQPHGAFTGSSVAAVVTSATAAAVWAYDPTARADDIIDRIYASGVDLQLPADFCAGGGACPNIHRLSICRAVRDACLLPGAGCDSVPTCSTAGVLTAPADLPDLAAMHAGPCSTPRDGNLCLPGTPDLTHDAWQLGFVQRQPTDPICTVCTLYIGWRQLSLDTNPLTNPTPFVTQSISLWDDWGSLTIDTHWDPRLQFVGGNDLSSGIDLSLSYGQIYWSFANFSYWVYDGFWGSYQSIEGQWLFLAP